MRDAEASTLPGDADPQEYHRGATPGPTPVDAARRRTATALVALCAGVFLAEQLWRHPGLTIPAWASSLAAAALAGLAWFLPRSLAWGALTASVFSLGVAAFSARVLELPHDQAVIDAPGTIARFEGVVLDTPREEPAAAAPRAFAGPSTRCTLSLRRVWTQQGWRRCSGTLTLVCNGSAQPQAALPGACVRAEGIAAPPAVVNNPGQGSARLWQGQSRRVGTLRCADGSAITPSPHVTLGDEWFEPLRRLRERLRERSLQMLVPTGEASQPGRALLAGLLLGAKETGVRETEEVFARVGVLHILAISGFHLTLVAGVALWVLRRTGDRGWLEPVLVGAFVLAYLVLLPVQSSIARAGIMTLALLAAGARGKRYDSLCVLGWTCVLLVLWRPMNLWSLGFQLSAGLTGLLLWASEGFDAWLFPRALVTRRIYEPSITSTVLGVCRRSFSGAVLCWGAALPLIAASTGSVSLLGAIATTLLSPLFALLLIAGLLVLAIGLVVPGVGAWAAGLLAEGARASAAIAAWFDRLPGTSLILPLGGWLAWVWCWSATAAVMIFLWLRVVHPIWRTPRDADPRPRRIMAWVGIACAVVTLGIPLARAWRGQRLPAGVAMRIDMLDVGDGSCFLLRAGDDALLWDACEPAGWWSGRSGIATALRALGVTSVPSVVITHPDLDHAEGLLAALRPLGVREVMVPARFLEQAGLDPQGLAGSIVRACQERGVRVGAVLAADTLWIGNVRGTVLSPPEFVDPAGAWALDNDHSVVVLWEVPRASRHAQPARVLMTGDAAAGAIARLSGLNIPSPDVMELPHHGSAIAPSVAWVEGLSPGVVLQSTGPSRVDLPAWRGVRARTDWVCTAQTGWGYVELTLEGAVRVVRAGTGD